MVDFYQVNSILILYLLIWFNLLQQIDIDFDCIFPGKGNLCFEKWPQITPKILTLMHTYVKDSNSRELLKKLSTKNSEVELESGLYF